ncbi:MAG TPA: glycosyltransferase [Acidimicrobiales bacterium]|nr:glycosyltransferase [Acidimicrobiales bacterium]
MLVAVSARPSFDLGGSPPLTFGILSTFPPTPCGIATFTAALAGGLNGHDAEVRVVRVADGSPSDVTVVVGDLINSHPASVSGAAEMLNECDVAIVQHEYGLYGGEDGDEVVDILASLRVPSIVIAHTVLCEPTPHQRSVLVAVAALADRVVVMSDAARHRLSDQFAVDPGKVTVIPHGAMVPPSRATESGLRRPTLLTWGLVGPGKGIERVIDAMPRLQGLRGRPRYLVAGRTHPKVVAAHGEAYREARVEQAKRNGVGESVVFDATYRDVPTLTAMIQSAAVVVLPYDSREQATSGVLVDAVAAGRPVVATAFPHAVELLGSGAGIIVDHDDPDALVRALGSVLTDPALAHRLTAEARRIAPTLGWPVVAAAYLQLAGDLVSERAAM